MKPDIRTFDNEYDQMCWVLRGCYPEYPDTPEELSFGDQHRDPKCKFQRWVAARDGQVVGFAEHGQSADMFHPQKFWVQVAVHPEYQGQGIGTTLYGQVLAALEPYEPLSIRSDARADMERSIRFLQQRGFEECMRSWESRLVPADFDPTPYAGVEEKVRAHGIDLLTLKELEGDPERDRKLHALIIQIDEDVPRSEPEFTPVEFDRWVERFRSNPNLLPEGYFIAVDGGEYVGLSQLWKSLANDELYTGLTGTRRSHRRRGIALALKLKAIEFARQRGCPVIKTWNETGNRPMLSINEALGFVKQPVWIEYRKVLKGGVMKGTLRPFTPDDYEPVTAVQNAVYPEYPGSPEEMRFGDERRDPKCRMERWVVEQDGGVVAFAEYSHSSSHFHPQRFSLELMVHPEYQGQGTGRALYDHLLAELAPLDPVRLLAHAREDMERSRAFLNRRGFEEKEWEWESRLDVAAFDPAPFAGAEEKVRARGIELKSFRELADDPDRDRKLYELDWLVTRDMPSALEATPVPFEHFCQRFLEDPNLLPDAYFIAVRSGEYVGLTNLVTSGGNSDLYTGATGVRREYRRQGIALALKVRALRWAKENGYPLIKTWNEIGNRPMLSINETLGFVRQPAWIFFHKELRKE